MAFAFTVEDGTGLEGANSYLAVADADDYHDGRGNAAWAAADAAAKQAALVKATDYIDRRFGGRFVGQRLVDTQRLAWPREDAVTVWGVEVEGIPRVVEEACAEYALRALAADLDPDPGNQPGAAGNIASLSESVGPLSTSTTYTHEGGARARYPNPDALLRAVVYPDMVARA